MMFLSFILLFLLIKTLQEEQYYKLIEGEQFYIMSQEDENVFIYYQKITFIFLTIFLTFLQKSATRCGDSRTDIYPVLW